MDKSVNEELICEYAYHKHKAMTFALLRWILCVMLPVVFASIRIDYWYDGYYNNFLLLYCAFVCLVWKLLGVWIEKINHKASKARLAFETDKLHTRWYRSFAGDKPIGISNGRKVCDNPLLQKDISDAKTYFRNEVDSMNTRYWRYWWVCLFFMILCEAVIVLTVCLIPNTNFNGYAFYIIIPSAPVLLWFSSLTDSVRRSDKQLSLLYKMATNEDYYADEQHQMNLCQDHFFLCYDEGYVIQEWLVKDIK